MKKTIVAALLASALLPAAAFAQATTTTETPAAAAPATSGTTGATGTTTTADATAANSPFVTVQEGMAWRVSELEGTDVYGSAGEDIGEIKDILVDKQGQVTAVLVGVGGFLGIGEKNVAVSMNSLQFQTEAQVDNTTTASTSTTATGTTATTTTAGDQASATDDDANELERVVLNVTKEQLEAAPAYEMNDAGTTAVEPNAMGTTAAPAAGTTAPAQ
jgi:sporulation protein YlmC with PRC-barrel domain